MKVVSLNIGKKKLVIWRGKNVETGIFKSAVKGPLFLGKEGVEQDNVVDRRVHGGIDKAVYGFSLEHYAYFKKLHPKLDWQFGMFGENLTITNLEETTIFVGNQYILGETIIEVTKPRQPCMKLGLRFGTQTILKQFWNSTKSGIYFKVLQTGKVKSGDNLVLLKKAENTPSIAELYKTK